MKKFGFLIFIAAIIVGVSVAGLFSIGRASRPFFNFSFGKATKGSGNISTERRNVSEFKGIDVSGIFEVEVTAQKDLAVEVEADDNLIPLIKTEVRGGVLYIKAERRISSEHGVKVRVSAPDISDIDASGASKVTAAGLNNEQIQVHSSGASKINLSGSTASVNIDVSGASSIDAEGLKAETADVEASGASCVSVFASGELRSHASGASKILYSGSPRVEKSVSGASSIREK